MRERCIAEEVIRQLPRENLLSLVSYCAEGLNYLASPIFLSDDLNVPAKIGVFAAVRSEFEETEIRIEVREMAQVVTVVATPIPPNMRIQVWCMADWFTTEYGRRFEPAFTPCEVGADIMRYLLRMIEGNERADAWQPKRGKLTADFAHVFQPITLPWRISELINWVTDFRRDTNADILLYYSEAKGYIDIYNEHPRPMVGMRCDRPVNGAIELIPYPLEGATPSAIEELQRWRDALEAAVSPNNGQAWQRRGGRPSYPDNDWAREQVHVLGRSAEDVYPEWLERIGARAKVLGDPYDSFKKAIKPKKGK